MNQTNEEIPIEEKDSKQLAAIVVSYRILGMNKELSKLCMAELLKRKEEGDLFDYESFIAEEVGKSPKIPPIGSTLKRSAIHSQISSIFADELKKAQNGKGSSK